MGCSQSKMENEETVLRCKDRHNFMKQAVSARNAFATAHFSYATALKNAGAALTDFSQFASSSVADQPSYEVPMPPPPLPAPLHRSATMPETKLTRPEPDQVVEEVECLFPSMENMPGTTSKIPRKKVSRDTEVVPASMGLQKVKQPQNNACVNLVQVFTEVDDHFLEASETAHEVSKLLEATRLHYHSKFADNTEHVDYSARVMRVVTWNQSFRGIPNMDDVKDDFESEEYETLTTALDKLLAWEKKLYNQVKDAELMKFEYQKKVAALNKLKKRGTNTEALEKAKATVSHLHTKYIVDMQTMDSTISQINRLRDQQLYTRFVELIDGMANMWGVKQVHHEQQLSVVRLLTSLDIALSPAETSEHHHDTTYQLLIVVQQWQSQFEKLISNKKGLIKALICWLKLNLIPIECNLKENISSPPRVKSPPIESLLLVWHDHLEKLPDELAKTAIADFAAAIDTIFHQQEEEIVLKRKCEETRKEHTRKSRQFDEWEYKYKQKKRTDEFHPDRAEGNNDHDGVVREKKLLVEQVKRRLDEEEEAYAKQSLQVRQITFGSLRNSLPELFRAMSDFSLQCSKIYSELRFLTQKLSSGQSLS